MKNVFIGLALIICMNASSQTPKLRGDVTLNLSRGSFDCELTIDEINNTYPYEIWLNSGMNIQWVRNNETNELILLEKNYDASESFECLQYVFPDSLFPNSLTFRYAGAFPVVEDTDPKYEWEDWMGAIAINKETIRASNQSAWHPIVYSLQDSLLQDKMPYQLNVSCEDFSSIYISGSPAQSGMSALLECATPVHLMLFGGTYSIHVNTHIQLLNSSLSTQQMSSLDQITQDIIEFYEQWLGIPYGQELTFVQSKTISTNAGFSFFSYPTITYVECDSWGMESMFSADSVNLNPEQIAFIAHEIAHYYIGTRLQPKGPLFWFVNEGLTEFLALNYVEKQLPQSLYNTRTANYIARAEQMDQRFVPICKVISKDQLAFDLFRYNYAPLVFAQMQREFGESKMQTWIQNVLNGATNVDTFDQFQLSLVQANIPKKKAERFIETYLCGVDAFEQLMSVSKK